jgi:hypothetical protein
MVCQMGVQRLSFSKMFAKVRGRQRSLLAHMHISYAMSSNAHIPSSMHLVSHIADAEGGGLPGSLGKLQSQ